MEARSSAPARILLLVATACLALCGPSESLAQATIVDIATDATDPNNLADTEPSIAVNPANPNEIAIVAFSENWGPGVMAPVWKSNDGGVTWRKVRQLPQPTVPAATPGQPPIALRGPADQKIAFTATGDLFVAELGVDGAVRDFVYRQAGGPDAALTPGAAYGDDQPHLDLDRTAAGQPCSGRVYAPWLNFGVTRPRSTVSWSNDQGVAMHDVGAGDNATYPNRTTRIAVASDGRAYIVYKTREGAVANAHLPGSTSNDFENAHFRVQRSDDCGQNWNALGTTGVSVHGANTVETLFTTVFGVSGAGRKVARARSSDAWIAADPGNVYAAYVSRDGSGFAQIYVARSTDRGATWASRRATDGTHHSGYPEVALAANGVVGLLYVDFEDTGTATSFRHRFARSFDRGQTWHDQVLQTMDPAPFANAESGFLWGDYEGLTAQGNAFYGVFTGASIGRTTAQLDPIFFTDTAEVPDLIVASCQHSPASPTTESLITFTAVVQNVGTGQAGPSVLSFRVGGETPPGRTFAVPALAPGATFTASRQETLTVAQNYRNTVIADVNGQVRELREDNNECRDEYTVIAACQDGARRNVGCMVGGLPGVRRDVCVNGRWQLGRCVPITTCREGAERYRPCPLNGRQGFQLEVCRHGKWVKTGACLPNKP